jgi:hypothetical protein
MEQNLDDVRRDIYETRAAMGRKIAHLRERIGKTVSSAEGLGVVLAGGWLAARLVKRVWRRNSG